MTETPKEKPIEVYYMEKCEEVKELKRKLQKQARQKDVKFLRFFEDYINKDSASKEHRIKISKYFSDLRDRCRK